MKNEPIPASAREALFRVFGYPDFRPGQAGVIGAILSGRDVLGVMPTGAGKSLCYQVPALLLPGLTLVISPLISLMEDQVASLRRRQVPAAFLSSAQTRPARSAILRQCVSGRIRLLYVSPERLRSPEMDFLRDHCPISLLAVDEAHCVSQWGREFRPAYLEIKTFLSSLPVRPVTAAFTATATPAVRRDIISLVGLQDPFTLTTGFDRPNLYFEVRKPLDKWSELRKLLALYDGTCGIIYCLTRRTVESTLRRLLAEGVTAGRYHAGMDPEERSRSLTGWLSGRFLIMVATNAFGMGIDKPDVRFVIHYNMPGDLENYYQEAGRAGRDGKSSACILLTTARDLKINRFFISHSTAQARVKRERFLSIRRYASGHECLRKSMLGYFGEEAPEFCGNCSVCLHFSLDRRPPLVPGVEDPVLLKELRALRKRLSKERKCLPYKVFSDTVLHDMARVRPTTLMELIFIEGSGLRRCLRYGRHFVREIREYLETR